MEARLSTSKEILKDTSKTSGSNIVAAITGVFRGIIVARFLGPEIFGVLNIINLVATYIGLVNPGVNQAATRDMPYYSIKRQFGKVASIKDTAFSFDILTIVLISLGVIAAALFLSNPLLKWGLILIGFSLLPKKVVSLYHCICRVSKKFGLYSKVTILNSIIWLTWVAGTIYWFGIYSVLLVPIIASILIVFYYRRSIRLDFHFHIDKKELKNLLKVGVPLSLVTLAYWGFRLSDRTIVASFLGAKELGYYALALFFFNFFTEFLKGFGGVIQPNFQERLGKMGLSSMKGFVVKPTLVFAYSAPFLIGLTLLFVHLPIIYLLPQYVKSITPLKILSFNVFLSTIPVMQGVLLSSTEINRQMQLSIVWALAIGLNIILNYFFIRANWGISGVALATVISRGSVTATYFVMAHKYYLKGFISSIGYYLKLGFPLVFAWLIVTLIQRFSGYQSFSPLIIVFQLLAFSLAYLPLLMYMNKKTKFFAQIQALFLRKTA